MGASRIVISLPCHSGKAHEGADLDVITRQTEPRPVELPHALDLQDVRPHPLDLRPHLVEEGAEILNMGLRGCVPDHGSTLGESGRHDGVLGSGHRGLIQEDPRASESFGYHGEAVAPSLDCTEGTEGEKMGVQPPAPDDVSPRKSQVHAAKACQEGARQEDRGSDSLGQLGVRPASVHSRTHD